MEIAKKIGPKAASLTVSGEVSLRDIGAIHEVLVEAVNASKGRVHVDVSLTEKGGLPLLQLLMSAHKTLRAQGRDFTVSAGEGHPLATVADAAGLSEEVGFVAGKQGSGGKR
jgi:hypothetical protein